MKNSVIIGSGSYLPEKVVTNKDLEKIVDTSDEWITTRTGITKRHIAAENEYTSNLAVNAAKDAINNSNITAKDIDLIVVATTTPDKTFPSVAVNVQAAIGASNAAAFDIQAVCAGFIYALSIADSYIKTGKYNYVLVIGADKMSSILDWNDRNTCVLFGDGAGALLLKSSDEKDAGILTTNIYSDGTFADILNTSGGVSSSGDAGKVCMQGQEVFKHAVSKMADSVKDSLKEVKLTIEDIKFLIPHQANSRILDKVAKKLMMSDDKIISTVARHANTSAASIPLAIDYANKNGKFKTGDLLALTAIGGGLTWGSCLVKW